MAKLKVKKENSEQTVANVEALLNNIKMENDIVIQPTELKSEPVENKEPATLSEDKTPDAQDKTLPGIGTKEWSDFLLSQLYPNELTNNKPNNAGLRRLFELHVGEIIGSSVQIAQTPMPSNGNRASVVVQISYNKITPYRQEIRTISDAADCYEGNTNFPYCNFPVGTATTVAESRVFRKALSLNTISAEEASAPSIEQTKTVNDALGVNSDAANDNQKRVITNLIDKIGLDLTKFMTFNKVTMDTLTYTQAQELLRKLNSYERGEKNGGEHPPEELYK